VKRRNVVIRPIYNPLAPRPLILIIIRLRSMPLAIPRHFNSRTLRNGGVDAGDLKTKRRSADSSGHYLSEGKQKNPLARFPCLRPSNINFITGANESSRVLGIFTPTAHLGSNARLRMHKERKLRREDEFKLAIPTPPRPSTYLLACLPNNLSTYLSPAPSPRAISRSPPFRRSAPSATSAELFYRLDAAFSIISRSLSQSLFQPASLPTPPNPTRAMASATGAGFGGAQPGSSGTRRAPFFQMLYRPASRCSQKIPGARSPSAPNEKGAGNR
jgi:hypothetical protein